MRYTLKDYQDDAVGDVLTNLKKAARDWKQDSDTSAFSLTATTGAGKTVMAAAVIESLFDGNTEHNFEPDPGAVVLWFTDDPSLNQQTRLKLMDSADRIPPSRLVVIENTFSQEKLEAGKVYFLNQQKLSKNSLLVKGGPDADDADTQQNLQGMPPPDNRAQTLWETLRNTIEDDNLTLYLILDEAHRGMKSSTPRARNEKATIVQRLVNGANGVPPVPVVWGISATVERFDQAMAQQQGRTKRPNIVVDPARVQESGLLKDDIRLDFPTEQGTFDTTLLARAVRKVKEASEHWQEYAEREDVTDEPVIPLLVVQMPNTPSDELLQLAFSTIYEHWPELPSDAMANVFGDHKDIGLAGFNVPYIEPERVQDRPHIRILFAKDAISTGWDCPRAEVFVSFRPAQDMTYITQLLGRMVRTPLARRIPGNDLLNSVTCVLPHFNRATAKAVAETMIGDRSHDEDGSGGGDGRRVLIAPVDMTPNPAIPEAIWQALDSLPSHTLPRKAARPVIRFTALAQSLSQDGLRKNALKETYKELCAVLDGITARHKGRLIAAREDVQKLDGETLLVSVKKKAVSEERGAFMELADDRAIDADYKAAGRLLTPELAKRYAEHLADEDDDDTLLDAHITVAALGKMQDTLTALDEEADKLTRSWFDHHRVDIKGLSDERQVIYDRIKGMSPDPQRIDIKRPRVRTEETQDEDGNPLDTRSLHLMADENGLFPVATLNEWEMQVLDKEMGRSGFQGWYRNPSRASDDALAVAWQDASGNWRRMCPDFLFFHGSGEDIKVSIVDPHGQHLSDALPKLRGLSAFAESFGEEFHRIEALAKTGDQLRVLDLKKASVREAINSAQDAESLYAGPAGSNY